MSNTDKSAGSVISKRKQNAINTSMMKQTNSGQLPVNNTSIQEEDQAKRRTRNSGYILPRKVTGVTYIPDNKTS